MVLKCACMGDEHTLSRYGLHVQMPEDGDMDKEVREEDAADVAARKRAAAKAREEAELRQRTQVHFVT